MASDKSTEVFNSFRKYVETHNKILIRSYSINDIDLSLCEYIADKDFPCYKAMEIRKEELKNRRKKKDKWLDRLYGFITGAILMLLANWLRSCSQK